MSDSTPQELTPQEQIYALQQELIQVREKGGDRTLESAADCRYAECEVLGKLGIADYRGQQWQEAIAFDRVSEFGAETGKSMASSGSAILSGIY